MNYEEYKNIRQQVLKSDANIPALLEELWEVDFETWKDIRFLLLNSMMFSEPRNIPLEQHIYQDIIQGCIQRAIAAWPGWYFGIIKYSEYQDRYHAVVEPPLKIQYIHDASTPAAALLAAYIEAVRASK